MATARSGCWAAWDSKTSCVSVSLVVAGAVLLVVMPGLRARAQGRSRRFHGPEARTRSRAARTILASEQLPCVGDAHTLVRDGK